MRFESLLRGLLRPAAWEFQTKTILKRDRKTQRVLTQEIFQHMAVDIGQTAVEAVVTKRQSRMIDA